MTASRPGWDSRPERAEAIARLLPPGTLEAATASMRSGLEAAGHTSSQHRLGQPAEVRSQLLAPVLLDPDWPEPSAPLRVGAGWVHADLTDDDHDAFARLRQAISQRGDTAEPETLAAEAQQWRLPVTPYRAPTEDWPDPGTIAAVTVDSANPPADRHPAGSTGRAAPGQRLDSPVVLDLTALWAGPLTTMLLASLGATVIKIDSDARPDGLRAHDAVYRHLNDKKQIENLDLRRDLDRRRFEEHLARADLVIDSFSRRVLPNLGYAPADLLDRHPRLRSLSIVAFDTAMAEADWVSYGPGVHALAGLGHTTPTATPTWPQTSPTTELTTRQTHLNAPSPAPIAYPDALAGFQGFATAAAMLAGQTPTRRAEVSLAAAVGPLVTAAVGRRPDPTRCDAR